MLRKIISFILVIVLSLSIVTFAQDDKFITKVADFSTVSSIMASGMPVSSQHTKSGSFSMKWAGADMTKRIIAPALTSDFSSGQFLEFYMYSACKTKADVTVALVSNNAETSGLDYYYTTVNVGYTGWKYFSLSYNNFKASGTPAGLDAINEIRLWATASEGVVLTDTELYIDSIYITNKRTDVVNEAVEHETYTVADFSNSGNVAALGFPSSSQQTVSGDVSLKWADPNLKKAVTCTGFNGDWSSYNSIAITMYNEVINGSTITILAYSQNEAISGSDYYSIVLPVDFTGWETVLLPISDFRTTRNPLGWDQITSFSMNTTWGATDEKPCSLEPGTEIYIDKIFVTTEEEFFDDSVDYFFPHFEYEDHVDMASKVKELHSEDPHPRFHFNQQELDEIRERIKTDVYSKKSYENVISSADNYMTKPIQTYELSENGLPRTPEARLPVFSMAFLLSGEEKYKDRLWEELESICLFPDWHHQKMLDVGNYGLPVAIAYDWLYDYWTPEQRRTIRNALVRHCLEPGISGLRTKSTSFAVSASNWNQVVNSAIGLSALAIADEPGYEGIANEAINLTCKSIPISLEILNPDGGTHEGVTYWQYGLGRYFLYQDALLNCCGYDFGLSELPGLSETGYFPIALMGPTRQMFNYGDASISTVSGAPFHWLARLYDKPELSGYNFEIQANGGGAYDLAVYRPFDEEVNFKSQMPLDMLFVSADYVASTRSSWLDRNALFAGYIAGSNQTGHGDMDIGSFILEALGTRWIPELGSDNYFGDGTFNFSVGGGRWKYYRKGAQGQNVVIMNPRTTPANAPYTEDQNPLGSGEISPFKNSKGASYGVIDLTSAYSRDVESYQRGFALVNNRSQFVVKDEIVTKKNSELYSFFHTQQKIHIADSKTAYMYTGVDFENATTMLKAELICDSPDAEFIEMKAEHIIPELAPADGNDNSAYRKLAVYIPYASNPDITVVFTPMLPGQKDIPFGEVKDIAHWDEYLVDGEVLTSLKVDGIPVNGFTSFNTCYSVNAGIVGEVTASGADGVKINIVQAENIGDTAYVYAEDKHGKIYTYTITFNQLVPSGKIEAETVAETYASDVPEPENVPEDTLDGDTSSYWAADSSTGENGEQWIIWDMGKNIEFDTVYFAFWKGNVRNQKFKILVSQDNKNYVTVFDGQSPGNSSDLQPYSVGKQNARYIKFVGYGNTVNSFNSISEFAIPKSGDKFTDMVNHWAKDEVNQFASAGIVNGVSETEFSPDAMVTRAEFAELLYRTMSLTAKAESSKFTDVPETAWYYNSVNVLNENGIIPEEMVNDNSFEPDKPITREEITALVIRAYEQNVMNKMPVYSIDVFADKADISPYAVDYVDKAVSLHVIKGVTDTTFEPKSNATRAQAVVILKRFFSVLNLA